MAHAPADDSTVTRRIAQIRRKREEVVYLVDEILALEARLPHPPEPICPGCDRTMPLRRQERRP